MRLAEIGYSVTTCRSSNASPTGTQPRHQQPTLGYTALQRTTPTSAGHLPALEHGDFISQPGPDEFAAAASIVAFLKKRVKDLDASLSLGQRADLLAFRTLVETRRALGTATVMCMCRYHGITAKLAVGCVNAAAACGCPLRRLNVAALYSMWLEPAGFNEYRKASGLACDRAALAAACSR
jgi:hypothetical protein